MKDYHQILGVSRTANQSDIRRAYRRLAMEFHPDKNSEKDSARKFREIREAYEALKDVQSQKKSELDEYVLSQIERFQSLAVAKKGEVKRAVNGAPYQAPSGSWHQFETEEKNTARVFNFPNGKEIHSDRIVDSEKLAERLLQKISGLIRTVREASEDMADAKMREESRRTNRIPESEIGFRS